MTYRVVQWTTGNVGRRAVQAIVVNPNYELVGLYAYGEDKVGRDAGDLAGIEPTGVFATNNIEDLLALKPDVVSYNPIHLNLDHLCRILESGINVVSTSEFITGRWLGEEVRTRLHDAGVRGTRFNFVAHLGGAPELPTFWRIVERVARWGWHIVLHFDAKDLPSFAGLLDAMPVPYVIDHMARVVAADGVAQEPFQELLRLLLDDRCWVKISGAERLTAAGTPPYDDVVPYARELIAAAPGRVLWGTDWPHPNVRSMPDDGDLVDLLTAFAPDESVRNAILVDNPRRLYPLC